MPAPAALLLALAGGAVALVRNLGVGMKQATAGLATLRHDTLHTKIGMERAERAAVVDLKVTPTSETTLAAVVGVVVNRLNGVETLSTADTLSHAR